MSDKRKLTIDADRNRRFPGLSFDFAEAVVAGARTPASLPTRLALAAEWAEKRPVTLWALLALAAGLVALAGLPWLPKPRQSAGGDPLGIQAVMALTFDSSPLRWITGPSIDERSYRPLCMLLHWLEFRAWGTNDASYCFFSACVHIANAILLALLTAALAGGPRLGRAVPGLAAALFFAGSPFADSTVLDSIIGFWPSQSDGCALLFAQVGLLLLVSHLRTGRRASFAGAMMFLAAATWFKEIAYAAILIAAGLAMSPVGTVARPERSGKAARLIFLGAGLWALRYCALNGTTAYAPPADLSRVLRTFIPIAAGDLGLSWPLWSALVGLAVASLLRARSVHRHAPITAGCAAAVTAALILGAEWGVFLFVDGWKSLFRGAGFWLGLGACVYAAYRGRVSRTLLLGWLLTAFIVSPFPLTRGWYGYWPQALGSAVQALALPYAFLFLLWLGRLRPPTVDLPPIGAERPIPASRLALAAALMVPVFACAAALWPRFPAVEERTTVEGSMTTTRLRLKGGQPGSRPALLIAPASDFPVYWDRSDRRTSVAEGLARLGYEVCVVHPVEGKTFGADHIAEYAAAMKTSSAGVAAVGWGRGANAAVELSMKRAEQPDMHIKTFAAFLDREAVKNLPAANPLAQVRTASTSCPKLYVAIASEDRSQAEPAVRRLKKRLEAAGGHLQLNVPYNTGPIFPNEPNHWKRSLDLCIEFLVRELPPPPTP